MHGHGYGLLFSVILCLSVGLCIPFVPGSCLINCMAAAKRDKTLLQQFADNISVQFKANAKSRQSTVHAEIRDYGFQKCDFALEYRKS